MPQNSFADEMDPNDDRYYGGPEMSIKRQVMNVIPGLRLFIREYRRAARPPA